MTSVTTKDGAASWTVNIFQVLCKVMENRRIHIVLTAGGALGMGFSAYKLSSSSQSTPSQTNPQTRRSIWDDIYNKCWDVFRFGAALWTFDEIVATFLSGVLPTSSALKDQKLLAAITRSVNGWFNSSYFLGLGSASTFQNDLFKQSQGKITYNLLCDLYRDCGGNVEKLVDSVIAHL